MIHPIVQASAISCVNIFNINDSSITSPQNTLESHFEYKSNTGRIVKFKIQTQDPKISEIEINQIYKTYSDLVKLLEGTQLVPDQLTINLTYNNQTGLDAILNGGSSYSSITKTVTIPYLYSTVINDKLITQSALTTKGIQVHEFGHAFLDTLLSTTSQFWQSLHQDIINLYKEKRKNNAIGTEAYSILKNHLSEIQYKKYQEFWQTMMKSSGPVTQLDLELQKTLNFFPINESRKLELQNQIKLAQTEFNSRWMELNSFIESCLGKELYLVYFKMKVIEGQENQRLNAIEKTIMNRISLEVPYDEFWADLLSVVYLNDPLALTKPFIFTKEQQGNLNRSFNKKLTLEDFSSEASSNSIGIIGQTLDPLGNSYETQTPPANLNLSSHSSIYEALDLVKYHVWVNYISNPKYNRDIKKLLRTIAISINKEIQSRTESSDLNNISLRSMNERLIKLIDKEFNEWDI